MRGTVIDASLTRIAVLRGFVWWNKAVFAATTAGGTVRPRTELGIDWAASRVEGVPELLP